MESFFDLATRKPLSHLEIKEGDAKVVGLKSFPALRPRGHANTERGSVRGVVRSVVSPRRHHEAVLYRSPEHCGMRLG